MKAVSPLHQLAGFVLAVLIYVGYTDRVRAGVHAGRPLFSPDTSITAAVWIEYYSSPLNSEHSLSQTAYVAWCTTGAPESVRSVSLFTVGLDYREYELGSMIHLSFSPDSRRLAVVAPYMFQVLDLATGRLREVAPKDELVSSMCWLDNDHMMYVAHTSLRGHNQTVTDRTFWKQRIGTSGPRELLHREPGVEAGFLSKVPSVRWPLEHWSPNGHYVLYLNRAHDVEVLDTRERRTRAVGSSGLRLEAVAWNGESTKVAWFAAGSKGTRYNSAMIATATWMKVDFTEGLRRNLNQASLSQLAWTPDDQYLMCNDLYLGGCLLRPTPFTLIHISDRLPSKTSSPGANRWNVDVFPMPNRHMAKVLPFPVKGWLRAQDADNNSYLVNYEDDRVIRLGQITGAWSVDGKCASELGYDKRFRIQRIDLPRLATRPCS